MVLLSQGFAGRSLIGAMSYMSRMWDRMIFSSELAKMRPGLQTVSVFGLRRRGGERIWDNLTYHAERPWLKPM